MADQPTGVEVSNPTLGSVKIFGTDPNTLFTVLGFVLLCTVAWVLYTHSEDARAGGKEVARELKEANKEVAAALKESNKEVSKVLNDLAKAMRERNCLDQFTTPQLKAQNAELCKRLSQ